MRKKESTKKVFKTPATANSIAAENTETERLIEVTQDESIGINTGSESIPPLKMRKIEKSASELNGTAVVEPLGTLSENSTTCMQKTPLYCLMSEVDFASLLSTVLPIYQHLMSRLSLLREPITSLSTFARSSLDSMNTVSSPKERTADTTPGLNKSVAISQTGSKMPPSTVSKADTSISDTPFSVPSTAKALGQGAKEKKQSGGCHLYEAPLTNQPFENSLEEFVQEVRLRALN